MAPNFSERIEPIDPDRFRFALGVYQAAARVRGPYTNPQNYGVNLVDEEKRSKTRLTFTDRAENRGMFAVREQFPDDAEFMSIAFRILSFGEILEDKKLRESGLIMDGEEGAIDIHDAVITSAAQVLYRKSGKMDWVALRRLARLQFERIEKEESDA